MEYLVEFTLLVRDNTAFRPDHYSARMGAGEELINRANKRQACPQGSYDHDLFDTGQFADEFRRIYYGIQFENRRRQSRVTFDQK